MADEFYSQERTELAEEIIRAADRLPTLTPGLRRRVLASATAAHRRAWLLQKAQVIAATVVVALGSLFLTGYYLAQSRTDGDVTTIASSAESSPSVPPMRSGSQRHATLQNNVLLAMRQPDSWAVVEAFGAFRAHSLQTLRNAFWE